MSCESPCSRLTARAVEVDGDRGRELGEQAHPRAVRGERLVGEDDLLRLAEQVRAVPAGGLEVVPAEREPIVGEERRRRCSSSTAAHSSSTKMSSLLIAVPTSPRRGPSARRSRDRRCRPRTAALRTNRRVRRAHRSSASSRISSARPAGVELGDRGRGTDASSRASASASSRSASTPCVRGRRRAARGPTRRRPRCGRSAGDRRWWRSCPHATGRGAEPQRLRQRLGVHDDQAGGWRG